MCLAQDVQIKQPRLHQLYTPEKAKVVETGRILHESLMMPPLQVNTFASPEADKARQFPKFLPSSASLLRTMTDKECPSLAPYFQLNEHSRYFSHFHFDPDENEAVAGR